MALRSNRFQNAYASFQQQGFRATSLSGFSSSLANKYQSAEDKIIDDNFREGLISTETYLEKLGERASRIDNTPLEIENLRIKIRETQQTYEDEKVQTAYQTGGSYQGYQVDDEFMYQWENAKLEGMDPNSTTYQEQVAKVQGLKDKWERTARSDYRREKLLEISQMPDNSIAVLEQKIGLYNQLADQAEADGDTAQADSFRISANNYKETYEKAKLSEEEKAKTRAISQQAFQDEQQIKYGNQPIVDQNSGIAAPNIASAPAQQQGVTSGGMQFDPAAEVNNNLGTPDTKGDWLDLIVSNLTGVLDELDNMDFGNIQKFYDEDDTTLLGQRSKAYSNKMESIALSERAAQENIAKAQNYADLAAKADAKGLVDTAANYQRRAQDYADRATADYNEAQAKYADIASITADLQEAKEKADKKAVARFFSDRINKLELNEKELTNALQDFTFTRKAGFNEGDIDPSTGEPLTAKDVYIQLLNAHNQAKSDLYQVKSAVFSQVLNDPIEADRAQEKYLDAQSDLREAQMYATSPEDYDLVVDPKSKTVKLKNVVEYQLKDEDGISKFDKLFTKIGYANYELSFEDKKGNPVTDNDYLNASRRQLDDYKAKTTIYDVNGKPVEIPFKMETKKIDGQWQVAAVPDLKLSEQRSKLGQFFHGLKLNLAEKGFVETADELFDLPGTEGYNFDQSIAGRLIDAVKRPFGEDGGEGVGAAIIDGIGNIFNRKAYAADLVITGKGEGYGREGLGLDLPNDQPGAQERLEGVPDEYADLIYNSAKKYGVDPVLLSGLLKHESNFDANADNGDDRGIAQINRASWPDITDEQAFDPNFAVDWAAKTIADLTESTGSEFNALRAYNGGPAYASNRAGYNGRPVNELTLNYANDVFAKAKDFAVRAFTPVAQANEVEPQVTSEPSQEPAPALRSENPSFFDKVKTSLGNLRSAFTPKEVISPVVRPDDNLRSQQPKVESSVKPFDMSKLRSTIGNVSNTVKDTYNDFKSTQKSLQNSPMLQQAALNVDKNLRSFAEKAKPVVQNISSSIKTGASNVFDKIKTGATNLYDSLRSRVSSWFR